MKYIFLIFLIFKNIILYAQNYDHKRDYVWRSGFNYWSPYKYNTLLDFNVNPTKIDSLKKTHPNYGQVGMICNTGGDFLLFSNGCVIADNRDSVINNALNVGEVHDFYCPPVSFGYLQPQSMILLPVPTDTNSFIFFHIHLQTTVSYNKADKLLTTKLTKNAHNLFKITYIDSTLLQENDLERGHLVATRHANGRDWWILYPKATSNTYHKILFTATGFTKTFQSIGANSTFNEMAGGQAVFSPDGTKYVRYNTDSDIRIFHFDRCTGFLSNPIQIPILDASDTVGFAGCAISANSRFLYIISTNHIYQFDLQARDIAASKTTVLTYDGGVSRGGLPYNFAHGQLGPDGKIYVSNTGGRNALHIIEAPDSAGMACRAVQRRYILLESISYALPYFPNFRLGALRGSPCDTLTAMQEVSNLGGYKMKLFPNPATEMLNIDVSMPHFDQSNTMIELHDLLGNRVYRAPLPAFTPIHNIDVSLLANGVYVVSLKINGQMKLLKKVTILH